MGALHAGHLSLVGRAREDSDFCLVSIFVNPGQFDRKEDLNAYPVDIGNDLKLLGKANVDFAFLPDEREMYPNGFRTKVVESPLSSCLEGSARPGYFNGVCTVLAKFFNIVEPQRVYFGQKDAQQLLVVRKMAADLNFSLEVVGCPTVREPDGLAISSRNRLLSPHFRNQAPILFRSLSLAKNAVRKGERDSAAIIDLVSRNITESTDADMDYVAVNHSQTLERLDRIGENTLISLAAFFGDVRLMDSIEITERRSRKASKKTTASPL